MNQDLLQPFDREYGLGELLRLLPLARLATQLDDCLGASWELRDRLGARVAGPGLRGQGQALERAVELEFEPLGQLRAEGVTAAQLQQVTAWLELDLVMVQRYRMASVLHLETVHADHAALQREHAELLQSEARFRALAGELERRVHDQVELIENSRRQLYQAERLASVGSLAAGMAHEINNPIGFIRSNLSSAKQYLASFQQALDRLGAADPALVQGWWSREGLAELMQDFPALLDECLAGADRVARIVATLKAYSNVDRDAVQRVDLNDNLTTVLQLIADQLPDGVQLVRTLTPVVPSFCDVGRINQVFLSLLQNALQAIGAAGTVSVGTAMRGEQIEIQIRDSGCGMSEEQLGRIFDPFYTTRDVGQGTGLGLTVVHDVVKAHGGEIAVSSRVGEGSCFTLSLPVIADPGLLN